MVRDTINALLQFRLYLFLSLVFLHLSLGCKSELIDTPLGYELLIEPEELEVLIATEHAPVIIEVGKAEEFRKGHIPGALNAWRPDYGDQESYEYGGMRASKKRMESLMGSLGIQADDWIVLYDKRGDVDAARLYWLLKLYGHKEISLLNGGKKSWVQENRSLSVQQPSFKKTAYEFPAYKQDVAIEKEEVLSALENPEFQILDARTQREYSGIELKNGAKKAGRIPASIHLDWIETVQDKIDFRFRPKEELSSLLAERNIDASKTIITYCHTGVRSAHLAFVLKEIMGFRHVYNYDGSWIEWSHFDELPFETDLLSSFLSEDFRQSCKKNTRRLMEDLNVTISRN